MLVQIALIGCLAHLVNGLAFLQGLDFQILDETQYCQTIVNIPDFDVSLVQELRMYASNQATYCSPTLEIRELQSLEEDQACLEPVKDLLIKDPEVTFLFWNAKRESLDELLTDEFYQKVSCNLPRQPYFFVLTQTSPDTVIAEEIQVYNKAKEKVLSIEKRDEEWKVNESSVTTIYSRRNNFNGYMIKAYFSNSVPFGFLDQSGSFVGYHGEIGTLVARKLNLTLNLTQIEVWGVKSKDGTWNGAIKDLKDNLVDMAMASFSQMSERLEVTDAGFTPHAFSYDLSYWKYRDTGFVYGMYFRSESWKMILYMLLASSILLWMKLKFHEKSENSFTQLLKCIGVNLSSLVILDMRGLAQSRLSVRIHLFSIALGGAMIFYTYSGVLVSWFSSESDPPPITSLESLATVPNLNILVYNQGSSHQLIIRALKKKPHLEEGIMPKIKLFDSNQKIEEHFINSRKISNSHSLIFDNAIYTKVFTNVQNGMVLL